MTNADLIIIVIGPRAVMIHGVPVKTYNALQNHIIVLLCHYWEFKVTLM